jgi:hypothetical protein
MIWKALTWLVKMALILALKVLIFVLSDLIVYFLKALVSKLEGKAH